MRNRSSIWSGILLVLLGILVVIFMYSPTTESVTSTLPWNLGDPALNTWILAWESHALVSEPSSFFDGNIFHPYGEAIKYSETMLPLVPVFGLVFWVSGDPVLAHNLVILGLGLLSVVGTYLLARRLVGALPALLAAAAFSFSGYVFMHQSQLQLLTIGFFPIAFLALFRALERRRIIDGVWLGVSTALLTTASFYYGAIWFVCLGVVVLIDFVRLRRPDGSWWQAMLSGAVSSTLLVAPIALVYGSFRARVPLGREVGGLGLNPVDFLTPAPGSLVYGDLFEWASARQPTGVVEHGFFMGFVVMVLALGAVILLAWGFVAGRSPRSAQRAQSPDRSRYEVGLLTAAGLVAGAIAVGPEALGLTFPFHFLSTWIPGFDVIRAVSRLAVPGLLAIAVLAAWCFDRLTAGFDVEQRMVAVSLVTSLVLVEMWVTPIRAEVDPPDDIYEVLAGAPAGAVVELPMRLTGDPEFAFIEGPRLLSSIGDWRPRFNGYSGGFPPGYLDDVRAIAEFPLMSSINRMQELDLRYVVLHGNDEPSKDAYTFEQVRTMVALLPGDMSVSQAGDDWLVELRPSG